MTIKAQIINYLLLQYVQDNRAQEHKKPHETAQNQTAIVTHTFLVYYTIYINGQNTKIYNVAIQVYDQCR